MTSIEAYDLAARVFGDRAWVYTLADVAEPCLVGRWVRTSELGPGHGRVVFRSNDWHAETVASGATWQEAAQAANLEALAASLAALNGEP